MPNSNPDSSDIKTLVSGYIIKNIISNPDITRLDDEAPLLVQGILDSLSLLKLVMFLEKNFGISVRPEELVPDNFATLEAIRTYVQSKMTSVGSDI